MGTELKTVGEVFSETFALYKKRAVPIALVVLISTLLVFAFAIAAIAAIVYSHGGFGAFLDALGSGPFMVHQVLALAAIMLIVMILVVWSQTASLAISVDNTMGITEAFKAGWKYFFPVSWAGALYLGIVISGLAAFIIPGIFFGLSMGLYLLVLIEDNQRGMDALISSHFLVSGHWWNTLGKFGLVWTFSFALSRIPVIGVFLSLIFTPFVLLYMVVVYRDLQEHSGLINYDTRRRPMWWGMAVLGMIVPILGLLGAAVTLAPQIPELREVLQRGEIPGIDTAVFKQADKYFQEIEKNIPPFVIRLPSAEGFWRWNDPVGDTDNPFLDVQEVAVGAGKSTLLFRITLADEFSAYFASSDSLGYEQLLSLYFDTDVDRDTGVGIDEQSHRLGYDFAVDILLERQMGEDLVQIGLYRLEPGGRQSLGPVDEQSIRVDEKTLSFTVAMSRLGADAEKELRMCFLEYGQKHGSGLAKDKLIPLH